MTSSKRTSWACGSCARPASTPPDPTVVWFQETGSDGPRFSVFFPAKDPASFYTHGDRNIEQLGEEQQTLTREFRALCRRVENVHWTIRRDLNYMPTN